MPTEEQFLPEQVEGQVDRRLIDTSVFEKFDPGPPKIYKFSGADQAETPQYAAQDIAAKWFRQKFFHTQKPSFISLSPSLFTSGPFPINKTLVETTGGRLVVSPVQQYFAYNFSIEIFRRTPVQTTVEFTWAESIAFFVNG